MENKEPRRFWLRSDDEYYWDEFEFSTVAQAFRDTAIPVIEILPNHILVSKEILKKYWPGKEEKFEEFYDSVFWEQNEEP